MQDSLQWRQCCRWESCKDGVTVIQSRQHQHTHKSCSNITPELSTQRSESAQVELGRSMSETTDPRRTCCRIDNSSSISTPRSRTTVAASITFCLTPMTLLPDNILRKPNHRISVFVSLSCRRLASNQSLRTLST